LALFGPHVGNMNFSTQSVNKYTCNCIIRSYDRAS